MKRSAGFTLIEFLVVLGIITILLILLFPVLGRAREAARRVQCVNNMKQIALALQGYHASNEVFPSGSTNATGPIASTAQGYQMSWTTALLPFVEQNALYNATNFDHGVFDTENQTARRTTMSTLNCPDSRPAGWFPNSKIFIGGGYSPPSNRPDGVSSYVGCHHDVEAPIDVDNHGVFFLNSRVRVVDVSDGLSQTLFLGEIPSPSALGWMSGSRSTLRNTGHTINRIDSQTLGDARLPDGWVAAGSRMQDLERMIEAGEFQPSPLFVGGFGSNHMGDGAVFALGDGSVRFLKATIDLAVFRFLGHRADGEALDESAY